LALKNRRSKLGNSWSLLQQFGRDRHALAEAAMSPATAAVQPRTATADRVVKSICPYCAVGCGQNVYVKDEKIVHVEGDPDSPISRGRLCPKGSATRTMAGSPLRETKVKYRPPHGTKWEELDLDVAMNMIADRVIDTRNATWESATQDGKPLNRTLGIASLGGATLDNEENYLMKKLYCGLGVVQVENQARI
jgi:formate dehydrogenase major subunit